MKTWLLITLILLTMITVIEANCACRINRQSEKNPSLQVTKNRCFGSVPELRIVEKKYGLKTYKSCRCTCVPVGYLKHQSDHLIRINWTKNIKQNKYPFLSSPFLRPSDNVSIQPILWQKAKVPKCFLIQKHVDSERLI